VDRDHASVRSWGAYSGRSLAPPLLPLFNAVFPLFNPGRVRHPFSASAADRAAQ